MQQYTTTHNIHSFYNEKIKKYKSSYVYLTNDTCISNYTHKIKANFDTKQDSKNPNSKKHKNMIIPNSVKYVIFNYNFTNYNFTVPNSVKYAFRDSVKYISYNNNEYEKRKRERTHYWKKQTMCNQNKFIVSVVDDEFNTMNVANIINVYDLRIFLSNKKYLRYFQITNIHTINLHIYRHDAVYRHANIKSKSFIFFKNTYDLYIQIEAYPIGNTAFLKNIYYLKIYIFNQYLDMLTLTPEKSFNFILNNVNTITLFPSNYVQDLTSIKNAHTVCIAYSFLFCDNTKKQIHKIINICVFHVLYTDYGLSHPLILSKIFNISMMSNIRYLYFKNDGCEISEMLPFFKMPNLKYIDRTNVLHTHNNNFISYVQSIITYIFKYFL